MNAYFASSSLVATADSHDGLVFVPVVDGQLDCSTVTEIHDHDGVAFRGWNMPEGHVPCYAIRNGDTIIIGEDL